MAGSGGATTAVVPTTDQQQEGLRPAPGRIIPTKLVPPQGARSVLPRDRLAAPADWSAGRYRLALITAPAGYGKTTTLCQWYRQLQAQGVCSAWLGLDEDDVDPARFGVYLVAALQRARPGLGEAVLAQLHNCSLPSFQPALESLVAELEAVTEPLCLFLDDFHRLNGSEAARLVQWLLNYAPPQLTFVLGSRSRPDLQFSELELADRVLSLSLEDLRFSGEEATQLLQQLAGVELDSATAHSLWRRTEGWPAAVQLASLSLRGSHSIRDFLVGFTGSDRQLTDYLGEVVLSQLPAEVVEFLLRSSVLGRLCDELCRAVTGYRNSQAMLERIEALNLFLVPLDRQRRWYRYHPLFAEFLRQQLRREDPDAPARLLGRGARWLHANGLIEEAIQHALAAAEYELAAGWIAACAEELVQQRGEHETLLRWMRQLPESYIARWPAIRENHAWSLIFSRRFHEADRERGKLEAQRDRLQADTASSADVDRINCTVQLQRCVNAALRDRADECRRISEEWLRAWPQADDFQKGIAHVVLGFACKCSSEFELGASSLDAAYREFLPGEGDYGLAWAVMVKSLLLAKQGRLRAALAEAERGYVLVGRLLGRNSHPAHMIAALLAAMHYERDELDQAAECLAGGVGYVRDQSAVDPLIAAYQTLARLRLRRGTPEEAAALLEEGIAFGRARDLPRLQDALSAELALLALRSGRPARARELLPVAWLPAKGALPPGPWGALRARLALAEQQPGTALTLLKRLLPRARKLGQGRRLLELQILQALALRALEREREALRVLEEALRSAAGEGYLRLFVDEGEPLIELLRVMAAARLAPAGTDDAAHAHMLKVLQACGVDATSAAPATPPTATAAEVGQLTAQELRILELLAAGCSNAGVAEALFISPGTVKWHLHNIYTKLGVRNRTAALAQLRTQGLLS